VVTRLEKANPSLKIIKLDLFEKFSDLTHNPAKYGFTGVTHGTNDNHHLFSTDGLHPTPQGHKVLAEYAFELITDTKALPGSPK
jgi:phospholipase/lecithinase/hemolysin